MANPTGRSPPLRALAACVLFCSVSTAFADTPTEVEAASGFSLGPNEGLAYEAPEVPLTLRLRGLFAADYVHYDRRNRRDRGFHWDHALLGLEGDLPLHLSFRAVADLRGVDTKYGLDEAWLSAEAPGAWLRITGGLLKVPLGIEHTFPRETLPFLDYGFPAFLAGRTDFAVRLDGEVEEGLLSYDLVLAFGEGFDAFGQLQDGPQLSARVTSYPFRWVDWTVEAGPYSLPLLSGLFIAGAAAAGRDYSGHPEFATSLRNKLVGFPRLEADRSVYIQLGYGIDLGPFRLTHEFGRGSLYDLKLPSGQKRDFERKFSSWSATFAWRITGEPYDSRPYRQRARPGGFPAQPVVGGGDSGIGTLEIAARYANGEIDRELIERGLTSAAIRGTTGGGISSQEFRTFSAALSWYPVRTVRLAMQLTRVLADQRPVAFDSHGRDTSFAVRLQVWF